MLTNAVRYLPSNQAANSEETQDLGAKSRYVVPATLNVAGKEEVPPRVRLAHVALNVEMTLL